MEKIKSNTLILIVPLAVMLGLLILLYAFMEIPEGKVQSIFWFMFGYLFLGTALAQKRSGYLWKNLSPGNRGKSKSEAPKTFVLTNIVFTIVGLIFCALGVVQYFSK
jgi:hypothetical protein